MSRLRRVDQLLSSLGYCSRREAQALCAAGRVTLEGVTVERAAERVPASALRVDGEALEFPQGLLVMVHKPPGVVCSHDERDGRLVYELLPARWRLRNPVVTTVGRLDKDTSGVLLLTDDGKLVQRLTSPRHHVDKVYVATLDGDVTAEMVTAFAQGLVLDDGPTAPAVLASRGFCQAQVTLREGRYHQVRRMFAACGLHVSALHRERFGPWTLQGLEPGAWRALEPTSMEAD